MQQVPRLPRESSGRAAETKERQSVHQTPCSAASPTPAARKQRQSSGDQGAPKRTSDPLQVQQVPRLPRESSGRAAETKERQSVHQTPCSAASPTPATPKQRQSSGDQGAPKRTSDPVQCSKSHACHAKAAAEQRRPRSAKAYIRASAHAPSPADAPSPTPDIKHCDIKLCDVKLCDVKLCDVKLCDVKLCDVKLFDVKLCDVKLCDAKLCDVKLCDVKLCDVKLCDVFCVMSSCLMSSCVMSTCVMSTCVM